MILHRASAVEAYADLKCDRCKKPKLHFGTCSDCPYSLKPAFDDIHRRHGFRVTQELYGFATNVLELDEDLETFGTTQRELTKLEREGIKILRRERRKFEKHQIDQMKKK